VRFVSRKPTEREAADGTHVTVIRFAWRPINCDDGHTYWLRRIVIEQVAYFEWYYSEQRPRWKVLSKMPIAKLPVAKQLKP
jgi:hypothetical protein